MKERGFGIVTAIVALCATASAQFTVIEDDDSLGLYATNINNLVVLAEQNESDIATIEAAGYVTDTEFQATNAIFQAFDDAQVLTNASLQAQIDAGGGDIPAGSITETELNASVNASLDLADSATQPTDSVTTLSDVSDAGSGIIISSAERTTLGTASQPADLVTLESDITIAYTAADTALSNALSGGASSVVYPVSPAGLLSAYTLDDDLSSDDWWGDATLTNVATTFSFVENRGYITDYAVGSELYSTNTIAIGTNFTIFCWIDGRVDIPERYHMGVAMYAGGSKRFELKMDDLLFGDAEALYVGSGSVSYELDYNSPRGIHTLALVLNSSITTNLILYVDGVEQDSAIAVPTPYGVVTTYVGCEDTGTYSGKTDNVYIWNRALSADEIDRLHTLEINGQYGVQGLRKP